MPFFNNNGVKLYYEVTGKGPQLMLINGLGCDTRSFDPLIAKNKERFTFINFDQRCVGKSDKPKEKLTMDVLEGDVLALAKHLGISRCKLLGFSMGGAIAIEVATRAPKLIEELFLVSTFPSVKAPFPPAKEAFELIHRTDVCEELLEKVYAITFGPVFREKIPTGAFVKLRLAESNPQPADAYLNQIQACESFDLTSKVATISCKTNIVVGDSDMLIPPENSKWLHGQIAGSTLKILKGVGHMAPIEAPDLIL